MYVNSAVSLGAKPFEEELAARWRSLQDFIAREHAQLERECLQLRHELAARQLQSSDSRLLSDAGLACEDSNEAKLPPSLKCQSAPPDESVSADGGARKRSVDSSRLEEHMHTDDPLLQKILSTARDELANLEKEHKGSRFGMSDTYKTVPIIDDYLEPAVCVLIIVNTMLAWPSTDCFPDWVGWDWIDLGFMVFFTFEILLKLYFVGCASFFFNPSVRLWNMFDIFSVSASLAAVVIRLSDQGAWDKSSGFIIIRVIRLVRFIRILRVLRYEFFNELLTMIEGLASGMRTLAWALVILVFPMYVIALLLTQLVGQSDMRLTVPEYGEAFGNVLNSLFTTFRCIFGDCCFSDGSPIIPSLMSNAGIGVGFVYVLFMMIITLGVFNLIMATFVDHAASVERKQTRLRKMERLGDTKRLARLTGSLVRRIVEVKQSLKEKSHSQGDQGAQPASIYGANFDFSAFIRAPISKEEFDVMIKDREVQGVLEDLDVNEEDREELFDVLDADGSGTMDMQELVSGIIKLRGDPRRSDIVNAALMLRHLQKFVQSLPTKTFITREMKRVCDHYLDSGTI